MRTKTTRNNADPILKKYRSILVVILMLNIVGIIAFTSYQIKTNIPDTIRILKNKVEEFNFDVPFQADITTEDIGVLEVNESNVPSNQIHINLNEPFTLQSSETGSYEVVLKLFGLFELKKISLDVIDSVELIPSGRPIGITLKTDGVLVLGTSPISAADGMMYEPALNILKSGDYIIGVNNKEIKTKEDLISIIQNCEGKTLNFLLRRKDEILTVSVNPVKAPSGEYKIGTWIRDDTQGIGTLTFITTTGEFGALGHGITDVDTGVLMEVGDGAIYNAEIVSIVKGKAGAPGELTGVIHQSDASRLGTLCYNTGQGIFGTLDLNSELYQNATMIQYNKPMEIALRQEVEVGKASILCHVDGQIKEYEIEIEDIDLANNNLSKGLIIRITDEELIELTGGIVQGMSGSPIIQNGKIIGAVTHVFVKDSTRGYGTFIENMIQHLDGKK
ncbi:MAG: SpoIVB peptidase [Lachnospiraceae bacterium]|nr:SpoIVB peptidase [Lachnospiraceae bacterium]